MTYGGFLKWGYPQIIHFSRIFHCKSSIWGSPILGNLHINIVSPFFTFIHHCSPLFTINYSPLFTINYSPLFTINYSPLFTINYSQLITTGYLCARLLPQVDPSAGGPPSWCPGGHGARAGPMRIPCYMLYIYYIYTYKYIYIYIYIVYSYTILYSSIVIYDLYRYSYIILYYI